MGVHFEEFGGSGVTLGRVAKHVFVGHVEVVQAKLDRPRRRRFFEAVQFDGHYDTMIANEVKMLQLGLYEVYLGILSIRTQCTFVHFECLLRGHSLIDKD